MTDEYFAAICDALTALGWEVDHTYNGDSIGDIEVWWPDPATGHAMQFSGWWLSWRLVDGHLAYGVGDDTADRSWRKRLDVDAVAAPEAVAAVADRAMHLLWHCDERDALRELHQKYSLLSALEFRMQELGRRLMVTPGMIRDALKPSTRWTP